MQVGLLKSYTKESIEEHSIDFKGLTNFLASIYNDFSMVVESIN